MRIEHSTKVHQATGESDRVARLQKWEFALRRNREETGSRSSKRHFSSSCKVAQCLLEELGKVFSALVGMDCALEKKVIWGRCN